MRFYPSVTERFYSPLTHTQLIHCVQANTARPFAFEFNPQPFTGIVYPDSFNVRAIRWYNNVSNRPDVTGQVTPAAGGYGSHLILKQRLEPFGFWFGFGFAFLVFGIAAVVAVDLVVSEALTPWLLLFPVIIPIIYLVSIILPFWLEANQLRKRFIELLKLREIGPDEFEMVGN